MYIDLLDLVYPLDTKQKLDDTQLTSEHCNV